MVSYQVSEPDLRRLLGVAVAAWGSFLVVQTFYCVAVHQYVLEVAGGFAAAAIWTLREWGVWLLLAPAALWGGVRWAQKSRPILAYVVVGLIAACVALSYRIGIDMAASDRTALATFISSSPRQLMALAITGIGAFVLISRTAPGAAANGSVVNPEAARLTMASTLLVTKGSGDALIGVGEIDSIRAAGNYAELDAAGETYLVRSTLNALEGRLPENSFVRVHRSNLVRITAVERIQFQAAGNGIVLLRGGRLLNVSKSYARELKRMRLPTA